MEEPLKTNLQDAKEALWRLAEEILLDDSVDDVEELIKITKNLENLKMKSADSASEEAVPVEFRCYFSKALIQDPVILVTGYTYDRSFLENYLSAGNTICPLSQDEITNTGLLIPNRLVKLHISKWCNRNGVVYPTLTPDSEARIDSLIVKLPSCPLPEKKSAVKDLAIFTKRPENHALFNIRKEGITIALYILLPSGNLDEVDPDYLVDLVSLVLHFSVMADIKKAMGEHAVVIPFLIESLRSGPNESRAKAAIALANLSELDSNIRSIEKSGAIRALVQLLHETEHPEVIKDVVSALVKLCARTNLLHRARADGLHRIALQKMKDHREFAEEMLVVLTLFLENCNVVDELRELAAAPVLASILKELDASQSIEEKAVALLHEMCELDERPIDLIRGDREAAEAISVVAATGTQRAKAKAVAILDMVQAHNTPLRRRRG